MDQPPEEVQPAKTFYFKNLLTISLFFATFVNGLFTNLPLLSQFNPSPSASSRFVLLISTSPFNVYSNIDSSQWTKLLVFLFCYLVILFAFPLLSAMVSTPVTSRRRLFMTHLWVSLAMFVYNVVVFGSALILVAINSHNLGLQLVSAFVLGCFVFLVDDVTLWRWASVLEPNQGVAAMKTSYVLICGVNAVFAYLCMGTDLVILIKKWGSWKELGSSFFVLPSFVVTKWLIWFLMAMYWWLKPQIDSLGNFGEAELPLPNSWILVGIIWWIRISFVMLLDLNFNV